MNVLSSPTLAAQETIAAIATPPGTAGLAVIRVSGTRAVELAASVFRGVDLTATPSHTAHYGHVVDADGVVVDEVLMTVFHSPRSYTGEDSVEISCHGGAVVTRGVLQCLLAAGARHAEPGEYTRRAFLNGRIDLVQAEAVADLIHAQSHEAHRASLRQLEGALSAHVRTIRERLTHAASMLELNLDFVEEDVAFLPAEELRALVRQASEEIRGALDSYGTGRLVREGVRVVLLGPPNVGKSSLLNLLLGSQRAIVTDVPGTTRDFIEEPLLLRGELFRFIDTAGLRATEDPVEREGIARTQTMAREADIICFLSEAEAGAAAMDMLIASGPALRPDQQALHLFTKSDLADGAAKASLTAAGLPISAKDGEGVDALHSALAELARGACAATEEGAVLVTNARHADCLRRGLDALGRAEAALEEGRTEEFVALDIREAIEALGEIIGEVTSDDVLNGIFARFCIGK